MYSRSRLEARNIDVVSAHACTRAALRLLPDTGRDAALLLPPAADALLLGAVFPAALVAGVAPRAGTSLGGVTDGGAAWALDSDALSDLGATATSVAEDPAAVTTAAVGAAVPFWDSAAAGGDWDDRGAGEGGAASG